MPRRKRGENEEQCIAEVWMQMWLTLMALLPQELTDRAELANVAAYWLVHCAGEPVVSRIARLTHHGKPWVRARLIKIHGLLAVKLQLPELPGHLRPA